jgi:hypothetical protein
MGAGWSVAHVLDFWHVAVPAPDCFFDSGAPFGGVLHHERRAVTFHGLNLSITVSQPAPSTGACARG